MLATKLRIGTYEGGEITSTEELLEALVTYERLKKLKSELTAAGKKWVDTQGVTIRYEGKIWGPYTTPGTEGKATMTEVLAALALAGADGVVTQSVAETLRGSGVGVRKPGTRWDWHAEDRE